MCVCVCMCTVSTQCLLPFVKKRWYACLLIGGGSVETNIGSQFSKKGYCLSIRVHLTSLLLLLHYTHTHTHICTGDNHLCIGNCAVTTSRVLSSIEEMLNFKFSLFSSNRTFFFLHPICVLRIICLQSSVC